MVRPVFLGVVGGPFKTIFRLSGRPPRRSHSETFGYARGRLSIVRPGRLLRMTPSWSAKILGNPFMSKGYYTSCGGGVSYDRHAQGKRFTRVG